MTINMTLAENWYRANIGKHTYSMTDPRFDCSYSAAAAFAAAAGLKINPNDFNTTNLAQFFKNNGLTQAFSGTTAAAKNWKGYGFALMSIGSTMASSAGINGHVGLITPNADFLNTTATDWNNGDQFLPNDAVQIAPWPAYTGITRLKAHTEIWALPTVASAKTTISQLTVDGIDGVQTWKGVQTYLNKIGYKLVVDGIPGNNTISALQRALNAKLGTKLVIDGIAGKATWSALQKLLGTPVDGVKSNPSQMIMALQKDLNSGKQWI